MEDVLVSDLFSRIFAMMNVGQACQPSNIIEPRPPQQHPDLSHYPTKYPDSTIPAPYNGTTGSNSISRASSRSVQPTLSHPLPQPQQAPHIGFRGASAPHTTRDEVTSQPVMQEIPRSQFPPPSPRLQPTYRSTVSLNGSLANSPSRIKVRDLSHIQSFASEEVLTRSRHPSRHSLRGRLDGGQQYEISAMPVTDIIEMVAGLLTKITTTNDRQHEHLHKHVHPPDGSSGITQQASSVLAFHGKNVPSITIASYLARIHKYCPTTYEVFLSLLIYFDRMTEMVNSGSLSSFLKPLQHGNSARKETSTGSEDSSITVKQDTPMATLPLSDTLGTHELRKSLSDADAFDLAHCFVVDSFNIHRLVMAGVTCASKFFSDVFYTNSRYAKVGGLPLVELNHLELQFLLLNDFRLSIPIEELDAYGTMLVEFYASEIVSQQHSHGHDMSDVLYVRTPTPH
ncbi:MAG: hypothetical protein Q9217_005856 [Psora testacea]